MINVEAQVWDDLIVLGPDLNKPNTEHTHTYIDTRNIIRNFRVDCISIKCGWEETAVSVKRKIKPASNRIESTIRCLVYSIETHSTQEVGVEKSMFHRPRNDFLIDRCAMNCKKILRSKAISVFSLFHFTPFDSDDCSWVICQYRNINSLPSLLSLIVTFAVLNLTSLIWKRIT